jgi:predicted ester cyclase
MQDNMVVVRRYFEGVLGTGRVDRSNELLAPDYVDHTASSGRAPGAAGLREMVSLFHAAFPDLVSTVEDTIAQDDRVATRFTIRGTQTGPFAGVAATVRGY